MKDQTADKDDDTRLKKRLTKLTAEKSKLELLVNMMTRLSRASGIEDTVVRALESLMMVIGAANIILFFRENAGYSTIDVFGKKQYFPVIEDPLVLATIETPEPDQIQTAFGATKMTYPTEENRAFTWVYPLVINQEVIGVIKVENTACSMEGIHRTLPVFFDYLARILNNEFQNIDRLKKANNKLKALNEELEDRVQQRTFELKQKIIEQTKTEKKLQESENKFRVLYNNSPEMYVSVSPEDAGILFCNDTLLKKTGYSRKEIIGLPIYNLYHKDCMEEVKHTFQKFVETGEIEDKPLILRKKNGDMIDVSLNVSALRDEAGRILYSISSWRDITEKKQAEEALKKSEQEMRSIFRAAPTGIGVVRGRFIHQINDRACEMTGYPKNKLIGQSMKNFYPADEEYEYVKKEISRQIRHKGIGTIETRWQCKDGKIIVVLLSSTPIDSNDLSKGFTFTALDITDLKTKESELFESEEKYRSMMEAMDDAAYICSSEYIVEYMNPAMVKRIGYDATGEICYKVLHGFDEKCPWCIHENAIHGKTIKNEITSPKDGRSYHVSNSPVFHTDGSVSMLSVFRDVTEIKRMESRVQQAQKMEAIGTLAGGIAHDFNNILFPIVGHTEMLLEDVPDSSPLKGSLNQIYTSALRARDLIKQILTFSRQENNEQKLMKMQPIIREALKLIRSTIPTTIEIKQDINPDGGIIKADPTQIHQIVMNLATNAYHAMEETGGKMGITLKEMEFKTLDLVNPNMAPGIYVCLSVTDTGVGMDKNLTGKIFDPFFTTKEKSKGTGMGLALVHGIVHGMGGAIQVYSEPGAGTQFHVYLPVEKRLSKGQEINSKPEIQGGTEHILLVDDEEAIVHMEKQMLKRLGYQVTSHTRSLEALDAFRENPDRFDLIITDMAMPKMPGDKLADELIKIRPDIPILLCTGFSESMSQEKIKSLGIKGLLLKPIIIKDLAEKMRKILDIDDEN